MKIWLDAQLSPLLATWIREKFNIETVHIRDLNLKDAVDKKIFNEARKMDAIVITKDIDFRLLQEKFGSPPKIIWLTCGNTSNKRLQEIFSENLEKTINLLESGEIIVEISGD
jgi:predicted nuclease of predicted toxin-antitoxin system